MLAVKLETGRKDHDDSLEHHVRRLVEEIVVHLCGVQEDLVAGEADAAIPPSTHLITEHIKNSIIK